MTTYTITANGSDEALMRLDEALVEALGTDGVTITVRRRDRPLAYLPGMGGLPEAIGNLTEIADDIEGGESPNEVIGLEWPEFVLDIRNVLAALAARPVPDSGPGIDLMAPLDVEAFCAAIGISVEMYLTTAEAIAAKFPALADTDAGKSVINLHAPEPNPTHLTTETILRANGRDSTPEPEHPEARCHKCGRPNPVWFAPNDLWNEVRGDEGGIVCPPCFAVEAEAIGIGRRGTWRFAPEDSTPEPGLTEAWAEAEAALPLSGWLDPMDGRWVIPSGPWAIDIRREQSGDGYFEPAVDGYWATAKIGSSSRPFAIRGDLGPTPAAALLALASRLREGAGPTRKCGSCGTPDHYAGDRTHPCIPPREGAGPAPDTTE